MRRAALICVLIGGGCTSISSHPFLDQPPLLSQPLQLQVTTVPPPDDAGLVTRDAILRLTFDDYPDPATAMFGPILLRSGTDNFDENLSVDLVGKSIVVNHNQFAADTRYEIVVAADVRALSGRTMGSAMVAPINVGEAFAPMPSPTPSPSPLTWDRNVGPILSGCAPFCHTVDRCEGANPPTRNPSRNLDLSGMPDDPTYGLIGVESVGFAGTDRSMLRVAPGDSANSMLMRKLLGGDPHADTADPPTANLAVPGRRMPLYESACGEPLGTPDQVYLKQDQLQLIQQWIDEGAVVH